MPKFRTTNRTMTTESVCYRIGYGDVQHLLKFHDAVAYTAGTYGWNSDIFHIYGNTYISTGYRPCGYDFHDIWVIHALDRKAKDIIQDRSIGYHEWEEKIESLVDILKSFICDDFHLFHCRGLYSKEEKKTHMDAYKAKLESIEIITGYNAESVYKYHN